MNTAARLLALSTLVAAPALGQSTPRVAIAAAAASDPSDCRFVDLQADLLASGRFSAVDIVDVVQQLPHITLLQQYDAVITWSNVSYADGDAFGDLLADYVDGGGGVVVTAFATITTTQDQFLGGRWITGGYEIIEHTAGLQSGSATLGTVLEPGHPLAQGVNDISGMFLARPFLTAQWALAPGGRVILEWSDGRMLAAVSDTIPGRVDLGLYPVQSNCVSGFLNSSSDGSLLVANALHYAATGSSIGTSYCGAAINSTGSPARMQLLGSDLVQSNALTLRAASLPDQTFGYFLCSRQQGFAANPGGSQGNLCLGGSIGRFLQQVQNSGQNGVISIGADLTALPAPAGPIAGVAGETWSFQAWYRDANPAVTSNFSDGASLLLR